MKSKLRVYDLVIETTRRCQLKCEHCLRGDAESIDIEPAIIDTFISKLSGISWLWFSGGEPSLNPKAIHTFINSCHRYHVPVTHSGLTTNGLEPTQAFLKAIQRLHTNTIAGTKIQISNDQYHSRQIGKFVNYYKDFSFAESVIRWEYFPDHRLLHQGRSLSGYKPVSKLDMITENQAGALYLNCRGQILADCCWSYEEQKKHVICEVDRLSPELLWDLYHSRANL